ncbi:MAG: AMP-binding protein [Clostridiaceae bacterium]|nr:AMP-binding protein [Clostridiaceae bacterium]
MNKAPLYNVRTVHDLRDMIKQSARLYSDKPAFLIKDEKVIVRQEGSEDAAPGIRTEKQAAGAAADRKKAAEKSQPYLPVSYKQYDQDVDAFGTRLKRLAPADIRVAILAETRYEWYVSYMATVNGAGLVIPLDKELPQAEIASLLNRSKATVLIYSGGKKKDLDAIRPEIPNVRHFICMDQLEEGKDSFFWTWLEEGRAALAAGDRSFIEAPIDSECMSILLFTSGTTAKSKAVMLSHRNICINLIAMCQMVYIGEGDVFLSVLPLHHTYECTCGFLCPLYRGCTIALCEGLRYITKNMQESKVTIMLVVPLMMELFYKRIIKSATSDPKLARKFRLGLRISGLLRRIGVDKRRSLFARVHDNFGGHLRLLIAGGASIDPAILKGMQDLGIPCIQGYGLTECAPILALNRDVYFNNRAAGLAMPGVEMKIIDRDENGIGEIVGRGANVMIGYYENEEATQEALDADGFFHTGDLGYIDPNGFVIITGRKKNVIVTKNGKNIFPEEIESLLYHSDLIQECLVFGTVDADGETLVGAEIYPNAERVQELFGTSVLTSDPVRQRIGEEIRKVNHSLVPYKYIRQFTLRDTEFEKTTSKKIKRKY